MPVGRAAGAIVECNSAGSKTRQTARRPHGYSGPFAPDPTWCRGHPMSVLLPIGGMPDNTSLFDHIVRQEQKGFAYRQAETFGRFKIDDEFELIR